tara:strand:+ start:5001 stop:5864 length:864 start_codon:yes stop_codon:yes gene_type:complete
MSKTNLILAGSGYLGDTIIDMMNSGKHNYSIIEIARTRKKRSNDVMSVQFDIDQDYGDLEYLENSKIIYMAPPDTSSLSDIRITKFLKLIDQKSINRFVYISTSGVYGDCKGKIVTEENAIKPKTDRARRRADAESQVLKYSNHNNSLAIVLRVPGIYGKDRLPLKRIMNREPLITHDDSRVTNLIHVEDLSRIVIKSLDINIQKDEVINVSDGNPIKTTKYYEIIYEILGKDLPDYITYEDAKRLYDEKRLSFLNESRVLDTKKMNKLMPGCIRYQDIRKGIRRSL